MTARRAARVDDNHAEIVAALRRVGCSVCDLSAVGGGVPDLLVGIGNRNILIEVKSPDAYRVDGVTLLRPNSKTVLAQAAWRADWRGPVKVVQSVDEALRAVMGPQYREVTP